ncbi:GNAT family N-acetyltransferase [Candidatus Woesearchaeota archaeon]|nr:GNAT family N-acetyltransferase [Candidatus Woesearchaeota archaeon]
MDYTITVHDCFDSIDYQQLKELIEDGFEKSLADDYNQMLSPGYIAILSYGNYYIGAAVVELFNIQQFSQGIYYLDKIVVRKEFQGKGIGKQLWQFIAERSPSLFWRAKVENNIIKFYEKNSDISISNGKWRVFSRNINQFIFADCFEYALQKKETLNQKEAVRCNEIKYLLSERSELAQPLSRLIRIVRDYAHFVR